VKHHLGNVPLAGSPFPPIADYAFLSDCEVTALVAPSGNIEWMCLPRMDGPSIFGQMLDRDAGGFRLGPVDTRVPAGRRYLPGTMVLETTWGTRTGWVIVRDVLLIGPWHHDAERSKTHRRSPTDDDADHVLLRTMRCVNGFVEMHVDCEPVLDYGRKHVTWEYAGPGYNVGIGRAEGEETEIRLTTDLRLGFEGARARARTTLRDGDTAFVALSWTEHEPPQTYDEAYHGLVHTADFWHEWLSQGEFPDHPWRTHLQRSALTLKGLSYAPTGAIVAAPTTSLPETPGGGRNWDYRYTWIRDSTFALWGLYTLGFDEEANDFFYFIRDLASRDHDLQIMYGIGGEKELEEKVLEHLGGYEGARPVRIGNNAYRQNQHDVWGAVLDSVYLHTKERDGLAESTWAILCKQVEDAIAHWREPDSGIWEVRGEPRHFTSSKVMCWVACDRGARLALLREEEELAERWRAAADEIHADVLANAVDERGVFTQHYETDALDASALLLPLVRFLPPDDPRVRATVLAVADELTVDGLVLRYKVDETDDGLDGEEGSFAICSFWLVSAMAEIGETTRARRLCEKMLGYASPLYLYAEEIDPRSGRHLGNFPQAFTHLALINAVMHVIRADEQLASEAQRLSAVRHGLETPADAVSRRAAHNGDGNGAAPLPAPETFPRGG
jgi:GH15 family glucan-1,4-alpha-glucosidase